MKVTLTSNTAIFRNELDSKIAPEAVNLFTSFNTALNGQEPDRGLAMAAITSLDSLLANDIHAVLSDELDIAGSPAYEQVGIWANREDDSFDSIFRNLLSVLNKLLILPLSEDADIDRLVKSSLDSLQKIFIGFIKGCDVRHQPTVLKAKLNRLIDEPAIVEKDRIREMLHLKQ